MIITSSTLTMRSNHTVASASSTTTTVRAWSGRAPADQPVTRPLASNAARTPAVQLAGAAVPPGPAGGAGDADELTGSLDARLASLRALIERMTGQRMHVLDGRDLAGRPAVDAPAVARARGGGAEITVESTHFESESTQVAISGSVTTADGRRVDLDVDLDLFREAASSVRLTARVGAPEPQVKDPLALSFGAAPALGDRRAELDLDGDGALDSVPFVGAGLAYLALDGNGNGVVDSGGELFGPATGDGFHELAAFDSDGNGWIDEADPVFSQLRLWSSPEAPLETLAARGVGAIGLGAVASPFMLKDASGSTLGVVRSTGVWLGENGSAGSVHQIDVVT